MKAINKTEIFVSFIPPLQNAACNAGISPQVLPFYQSFLKKF
jgi:hypothetical protein